MPVTDPQRARRTRPARIRTLITVASVSVLAAFAVVILALQAGRQSNTPTTASPSEQSRPAVLALGTTYLTTREEVERRAGMAAEGDPPHADALEDLLSWAEDWREHDPEPAEPLRIDGTTGPFVDDTAAAYGFALAYAATGDERWAREGTRRIMVWVEETRTTERTCPDSGDCQTSLIISRAVPGFVFAADLLAGSAAWTDEMAAELAAWLETVILPTAPELSNNWGDAGVFTRVVLHDFLGDDEGLAAAFDAWRGQMDLVATDGHIPAEVERGDDGMGYTQEALDYKVAVAEIAEGRGVDLYGYSGERGGTLKAAIDYLAHHWANPDDWPWHDDVKVPPTGPLWEIAYARWGEDAYIPIIEDRRPYTFQGHSAVRFTTLTHGVSLEGSASGQLRDAAMVAAPMANTLIASRMNGMSDGSNASSIRSSRRMRAIEAPAVPVAMTARPRTIGEPGRMRSSTSMTASAMALATAAASRRRPGTGPSYRGLLLGPKLR